MSLHLWSSSRQSASFAVSYLMDVNFNSHNPLPGKGVSKPMHEASLRKVHTSLSDTIGPSRYDLWIRRSKITCRDSQIQITPENEFTYKRLKALHPQMQLALRDINTNYQLEILPPQGSEIRRTSPIDEYVVGDENKLLASLLQSVATKRKLEYNPLYIYGPQGVGKTFLLSTLVKARRYSFRNERILLIQGDQLLQALSETLDNPKTNHPWRDLEDYQILIIDDFRVSRRPEIQQLFLKMMESLSGKSRQIILTSDQPIQGMDHIQGNLSSRIANGMVVRMDPPSQRTNQIILRQHLPQSRELPQEVVEFLVDHLQLPKNIIKVARELCRKHGPKATIQTVKRMAHSHLKKSTLTPQIILQEVADYFDLTPAEIVSKRQKRTIARARKICIYLVHKFLQFTPREIGDNFSNLSVNTVRNYCRELPKQAEADKKGVLAKQLSDLTDLLKDRMP